MKQEDGTYKLLNDNQYGLMQGPLFAGEGGPPGGHYTWGSPTVNYAYASVHHPRDHHPDRQKQVYRTRNTLPALNSSRCSCNSASTGFASC